MNVISFDLDLTCEFAYVPGPVTADMIKAEIAKGNAIVGGSDWPVREQEEFFLKAGIKPDMVCLKLGLKEAKRNWNVNAKRYIHIGDAETDREAAKFAGFEYMTPEEYMESLK